MISKEQYISNREQYILLVQQWRISKMDFIDNNTIASLLDTYFDVKIISKNNIIIKIY